MAVFSEKPTLSDINPLYLQRLAINIHNQRVVHRSPHMRRPRSNRTENNEEDTAEECALSHYYERSSIKLILFNSFTLKLDGDT